MRPLHALLALAVGLWLASRTQRGQLVVADLTDAGAHLMQTLAKVITGHEGRVPYVYKDEAGRLTFGIGHLVTTGEMYLTKYTRTNPAPAALVDQLFAADTATASRDVDRIGVTLNPNQRMALTSWMFNFGWSKVKDSTLVKLLRAGDYLGAADEFPRWNKVFDPVAKVYRESRGLTIRRKRERALFLGLPE